MEKHIRCIEEKIEALYKIIVIFLPENNTDYIEVCPIVYTCIIGWLYYEDRTSKTYYAGDMENEAIKKAKKLLKIGENYKPMIKYAYTDGEESAVKEGNERMIETMKHMNRIDYYRNVVK